MKRIIGCLLILCCLCMTSCKNSKCPKDFNKDLWNESEEILTMIQNDFKSKNTSKEHTQKVADYYVKNYNRSDLTEKEKGYIQQVFSYGANVTLYLIQYKSDNKEGIKNCLDGMEKNLNNMKDIVQGN